MSTILYVPVNSCGNCSGMIKASVRASLASCRPAISLNVIPPFFSIVSSMAPRLCSFSLLVVSLLVLLASTENKNSNIGTVYNLRKTYIQISAHSPYWLCHYWCSSLQLRTKTPILVPFYNLRKTYVQIQACMHNILTPLLNTSKLI